MMLYKVPSTNGRRRRQSRIGKKKRVTLQEEKKKIEEMRQELQRSIRLLGDQPKEEKVKLP